MTVQNELREIVGSFSCNHILKDATAEERAEIRRMQNRDSYAKVALSAIIFACIQLFFIVSDVITDFYGRFPYSYLNMTAEIIILSASIAVMIYFWISKDRESDKIRLVHFLYYFCLESGFVLYLASDLFRGLDNIMNVFFNLIVLAIFAVYSMRALVTLSAYILGMTTVLLFSYSPVFNWDKYQLIPLIFMLFFFCACFFRARNTKLFYTQVKLTSLANDLKDVSSRDFLTKLYNRTALGDFLENDFKKAVFANQSASLMMIDIDDFKAYNDFHSHIKGDNCLRNISNVFLKHEGGKFRAFRFGGEEFLIIGLDVGEQEMLEFAKSIVSDVVELKIPRNDSAEFGKHITVSVGCSHLKLHSASDYDRLLEEADRSLYFAKRNGKNCYVYKEKRYTAE